MIDAEGQPFHDPEADAALFDALREGLDGSTVELVELDHNVNDEEFADAMVDKLDAYLGARAMTGDEARAKLRATLDGGRSDHRRRRGDGAVGQVRRGRRHGPDHHLQLGPLPDGRPRLAGRAACPTATPTRSCMEMAGEVLPVVRETPVLAGVCGTDPFRLMPSFLREVARRGLRGRAELPDGRPDRRHVPGEPRGDRDGLRARGRDDPRGGRAAGC